MTDKFKQYTTVCYSGVELLKKYSLGEYGIWKINGEDPNCNLSGSHYQPHIATLEGRLEDVLRQAVEMPSFWTWGCGGEVTRLEIKKVIETENIQIEYKQHKAALKVAENKLESLRKEIISVKASIDEHLQAVSNIETKLCPGCAPGGKCRTPECKRLV